MQKQTEVCVKAALDGIGCCGIYAISEPEERPEGGEWRLMTPRALQVANECDTIMHVGLTVNEFGVVVGLENQRYDPKTGRTFLLTTGEVICGGRNG